MNNTEERIYEFTRARSMDDQVTYYKKESQLERFEIDLLAGEFINDYNNLPEIVQDVIRQIINKDCF